MLFLNRDAHLLHDADNRVFDAFGRVWRRVPESASGGEPIALRDAVAWLQKESGKPARAPIAVIGPAVTMDDDKTQAHAIGKGLAECGLTMLGNGLPGVGEAAAEAATQVGGTVIATLPDADWRSAHKHVTHALACGPGQSSSTIIAEAGLCLVALGLGDTVLATMAAAHALGRPVIALPGAPKFDGVHVAASAHEALNAIYRIVLNLDGTETAWR